MSIILTPQQLLAELKAYTNSSKYAVIENDSERRQLRDAARDLSIHLETGGDTIHRLGMLHLQSAMARVGIELGIFDKLVETEGKLWTSAELSEHCSADPALMQRLLRYLASFRMIAEVDKGQYAASNGSNALAQEGLKEGMNYLVEMISPTYSALPAFLRGNKYNNTTDIRSCPWQVGWKTANTPFEHLNENPAHMGYFLPWMAAQRKDMPIFLDAYQFQSEIGGTTTPDMALFVDIGGATGHQCAALRSRFPDMLGRVVLQDQAPMVAMTPKDQGYEAMVYDFFTPQPIKGARAYYMRNILHDWPDDKCELILRNIKLAMTDHSVILIDEMIVPSVNPHWRATQLDITMMTCLAAQERTLKQWEALVDRADLKIIKVVQYTDELADSILVAVPK